MLLTQTRYCDEDFIQAQIENEELSNVEFHSCVFRWTDFSDVSVLYHCRFEHCDFTSAQLNGVSLRSCSFLDCCFKNTTFFAATLEDCRLTGSDLRDADCSLIGIDGGDFSYVNLYHQSFQKLDFSRVNFFGANLTECRFNQCCLRDCTLNEARVKDTSFYRCDLRGAVFLTLDLVEVSLRDALLDATQCIQVAEFFSGCKYKPDAKKEKPSA